MSADHGRGADETVNMRRQLRKRAETVQRAAAGKSLETEVSLWTNFLLCEISMLYGKLDSLPATDAGELETVSTTTPTCEPGESGNAKHD